MKLKKLIIVQKEICFGWREENSRLRINGKLNCGSGKQIKKEHCVFLSEYVEAASQVTHHAGTA